MLPLVFSPGPANIVFAMSGMRQGVRRSIPLLVGVDIVFVIISLLVGFGFGGILMLYPNLIFAFQLAGSMYIVYLAYKFIKTKDAEATSSKAVFTFKDGVILQSLNPKGWTALFLMYSALLDGSFDYNAQIIALVVMLMILNVSAHFVWLVAGSRIAKWTSNEKVETALNYLFSGSLLVVAAWLLLQLELPA